MEENMKQYDVYIQGKFYKTISAKNTGEVLAVVGNDIKTNAVVGIDYNKSHDVKIVTR